VTNKRAPNEALRAAIAESRLSYDQLARSIRMVAAEAGDSIRTNKSAISQWISGKRPGPQTAVYIAEALSRRLGRAVEPADLGLADAGQAPAQLGLRLGPDPVAMLRRLGEADIQRRRMLTSAAYSVAAAALPLGAEQAIEYQQRAGTHRAGRAEIDAVRDMTEMYTRIDERHGGQHGRSAVVQYLTSDVAKLCRAGFRTEDDQRAMLTSAAEVAYLCGWKAYDAGEHGLAQRYYLQAFQLTREADDALHQAFILRILAHNGMDIRRPEHTVELAESALDRAVAVHADPCTLALFQVTRARALANAGRRREATTQLREAQDTVLRGDEDEMPHWAALWGSARACVSSHSAKTMGTIGDHSAAERHYAASARARRSLRRIAALSTAAEGRAQARQGHVEQACATWGQALDMLDGVRSARGAEAVAGMRQTLRPLLRRGARTAAELDERARGWQLAHA
jgi:tetratricopeptide (TPR) repeat protein